MWVNDAQPLLHDVPGGVGERHGLYLPQVPPCTQRHPHHHHQRTVDRGKALTVRGHVKGGPQSAGQERFSPTSGILAILQMPRQGLQ